MVIVWRDAMGLKKQVFHSSENKPAAFLIGFLVYFVFLMACEKITDTQRHFLFYERTAGRSNIDRRP